MKNLNYKHLLESFEISDYYERSYDRDELKNISEFLNYVEDTEGVRLPLVPLLDLYRLYTAEHFDCVDCIFLPQHTEHFVEWLKSAPKN